MSYFFFHQWNYREESDRAKDQEEWDVDVKDEVDEILADARINFEKEMVEYKDKLSRWKQQKLAKVSSYLTPSIKMRFFHWLAEKKNGEMTLITHDTYLS